MKKVNKKSFTLIEVLISIAIFSMLFLVMVNLLNNFSASRDFLESRYKKEEHKELSIKVLYNDILNAKTIRIKHSKNYDELFLKTKNSLYNFIEPYVVWYVSKNGKTLIRVEDYNRISLPGEFSYLDKFLQNVKIFKIYQKNKKYLVFIRNNKDDVYFEFYKGY